jgi:N-ethylmaleimide reductase
MPMPTTSDLFNKYQLKNIELQNRIVMAPMTRSRAINHIPNDLMVKYYRQRASAGLIITEGTAPSSNGLGYPRIPGIFNDEQIYRWSNITKAVHDNKGKIFLQIMHCGRVAHPDNMPEGATVVSSSAVKLENTKMYVDGKGELDIPAPKAMTKEDIQQAIDEYRTAAANAIKAGFDGVEIHAANGYLIDQFINPIANKREDEYGGNISDRIRFACEVAEAVCEEIGPDRTGMRISPYGVFNDLGAFRDTDETFSQLASKMNALDLVYLHIVDHEAMGTPEVPETVKEKIRGVFKNTIILSGGYDKESAERDLSEDKGELIAFGRPFISNPDLPHRMVMNAELAEWDHNTFYTPGAEGYTDYPALEVSAVEDGSSN